MPRVGGVKPAPAEIFLRPGADAYADAADGLVYADCRRPFMGGLAAREGVEEGLASQSGGPHPAGWSVSGAGINAVGAGPPPRSLQRSPSLHLSIREDCGQADRRAELPGDKQSALSDPAEAGEVGCSLARPMRSAPAERSRASSSFLMVIEIIAHVVESHHRREDAGYHLHPALPPSRGKGMAGF